MSMDLMYQLVLFSHVYSNNLQMLQLYMSEKGQQESLNSATKVAISNEIFLTTLKIAWSSGVASVSSPSLSVTLHDVPLSISSNNIKTALGIFGVVTSVKLKSAGLWQYSVVNFKDTSSAVAAFFNWSVLVRKDSVRILPIANQKEIISSKNAFKAKLVNLSFGCTVFEISDLLLHLVGNSWVLSLLQKLPLLSPKLSFNTFDDSSNIKLSFVESKSYAKTAAFVVFPGAAAANMNLDLGGSPKTVTSMLSAVFFAPNFAVESRLASLKSYFSELSVLIKSLVELVSVLVALVTKLLSTLSAVNVSVKKCVDGLAKQNKGLAAVAIIMQKRMTCLEKKCKQACLKYGSDNNDMVDDDDDDDDDDDNDDNNKDFLVYDNTFDSSRIKSSSNQTVKWISDMVKNSHELVSIMGKMYELDMFESIRNKDSTKTFATNQVKACLIATTYEFGRYTWSICNKQSKKDIAIK
ncbi:hypothetical protein G9A89_005036 [Geosiphon pyriformis]|nr:hypothetical protein G9A89_005036 [Geosiphon pyriformis]